MKIIIMKILIYLIVVKIIGSSAYDDRELKYLLREMNDELLQINRLNAQLEWESSTKPSKDIFLMKKQFSLIRSNWRNEFCSRLNYHRNVMLPNSKMIYLLCRGPIYSSDQARTLASFSDKLLDNYTSRTICRMEMEKRKCYHGEPDLKRLMSKSRNESELLWAWTSWRNEMSFTKKLFKLLVDLQNSAARNNGYNDMGECWREELEIPNLEDFVDNLYEKIEHLYRLLHAVVRFHLSQKYPKIVHQDQLIPAHLLGDLWSQNWESLIDLILPKSEHFLNITKSLIKKNYTVQDMVKHAEDYYVSLGFPKLSRNFWSRSIFTEKNFTNVNCHATATNMYEINDYRIIACLEINIDDFYVIHHEIGHIQYYMAYKKQPPIFQDGVNSAFHEVIGDSVMLGVMTSQHLYRLGFADDGILTDAAVTGKIGDPKFSMKLHHCDIYGSKNAAKRLRELMSRGRSVGWLDWVRQTTGMTEISPRSLLRYYEPVKNWLENEIDRHGISIGWK